MKYKLTVFAVNVPEKWTNFKRLLKVVVEHAPSTSVQVVLDKELDGSQFVYEFDAPERHDVVVTLDNRDSQGLVEIRKTAGFQFESTKNFVVDLVAEPADPVSIPEPPEDIYVSSFEKAVVEDDEDDDVVDKV